MKHAARIMALSLAAIAPWRVAASQAWRTLESTRQVRDSAEHHVRVHYGAGRFDVAATNAPVLYSMTLRYDEATTTPVHTYDAAQRMLNLGVQGESRRFSGYTNDQTKGELRLSLSRTVPMDLELELGATKATMDLGGLNLLGVRLGSGASEAVLDFSAPNRAHMRSLDIDVGAASFEARNLGNTNAASVRVQGGVGSVELDFSGQWSQDMNVDVELTLGKVTLHVPRDVGVRVEVQKVFASFEQQGLQKRGDAYFSDWPKTLDAIAALGPAKLVPGRGAALLTESQVQEGLASTRAFVSELFAAIKPAAAAGKDLRSVYREAYASLKPKYGNWVIFDHCMPFDVTRAYDEATQYRDPRIWTAERDKEMWASLQD